MGLDVVVADQDVELARLYCRFLVERGLSAEPAAGGLECLKLVRQQAPAVLVLDCELPWDDARGVLACLREDGSPLPVVLTTWNASPEAVRRLVAPPIVLCLRKFIPLPVLLAAVHIAVHSDACGSGGNGRAQVQVAVDPRMISSDLNLSTGDAYGLSPHGRRRATATDRRPARQRRARSGDLHGPPEHVFRWRCRRSDR